MPDRQSVIERLNGIHAVACGLGNDQCYLNGIGIKQLVMLINDATELLKAQEPIKPVIVNGEYECGTCLYELRSDADSFCPCCGREVKWN